MPNSGTLSPKTSTVPLRICTVTGLKLDCDHWQPKKMRFAPTNFDSQLENAEYNSSTTHIALQACYEPITTPKPVRSKAINR